MQNSTSPRVYAIAALTEMFLEKAYCSQDIAQLETDVIKIGHSCIAEAFGLALEAYDAQLLKDKPKDLKVHDIRSRTLATEIGDVSFSIRRYRDMYGCDIYLLADALDIPYGTRISPGAMDFLIEAASHTSYAKAAKLLARRGSCVRPTTVMKCLRVTGKLCTEEDQRAAYDLYECGVVPAAESVQKDLCMEADGTYFRVQHAPKNAPKRLEVKAMVAYTGKEIKGGKTRREGCVHHARVGSPDELWCEAIASVVGKKYDLSKIESVHLGGDGERWCRDLERYLPHTCVTFHLDPFHINRAIMKCFGDTKLAWSVIDVLNEGDKQEAIALLKAALEFKVVREKQTLEVISYLEGNIDHIALDGPSLGTMESENQHLYGVRMDSFPCAWSITGASDMARIISRRESKTALPKLTRERSMGEKRCARRQRKELAFYESCGTNPGKVLKSEGSGYLPPHQVDTKKMDSGKAYCFHRAMANIG